MMLFSLNQIYFFLSIRLVNNMLPQVYMLVEE